MDTTHRLGLWLLAIGLVTSSCDGNTDVFVYLDGAGLGRVTSVTVIGFDKSSVAIDCPGDCSEHTGWNSHYVLTATPALGSRFVKWDWPECYLPDKCDLYTDHNNRIDLTATFEPADAVALTVTRAGSGEGRVRSLETTSIDCGVDCVANVLPGTLVTLEATPAESSVFTGWSGACTGTGTCSITVSAAATVTATFTKKQYLLSVGILGSGNGTVASSPTGIDCGYTCNASFETGTLVTLTATPDATSTFTTWSGACTGTGPCTVTLSAVTNVTATFARVSRPLTVVKAGTGEGQVSSAPAGIDCGSTCTGDFGAGSIITLTAVPDATSTFGGWSGACTGTGPCSVTLAAATTVTATFTRNQYALTVLKAGTGLGRVTASPAGLDCGSTCTHSYDAGSTITLTATADASSTFAGWSGACSGTGPCAVALSAATTVSATFTLNRFDLTINKTGTGAGTVSSSPAGIVCGASCSASYGAGTSITLTATPEASSTFTGWSGGGCSGTGGCTVSLVASTTVTASFARSLAVLTVTKAGAGGGTITSAPGGITCGTTCTSAFDTGTTVTLTALPDASSSFTGWSGACTGSGPCVLSLSAATAVTATFAVTPYALTVIRAGTGAGVVTSSPAGLTCGSTCSASFAASTVVTLSAAADATSTFTGWSGGGCSGTGTCSVTVTAALNVAATFTRAQSLLTVTRSGTGSGTVTSTPAGITCGSTCSASFDSGTTVTLTATADLGSTFSGWSGGCTGTGTCTVPVSAATTVGASFALDSYPLTVSKAGTGVGTVTSSPGGISCGATCSANFAYATTVSLTATADASSVFTGWSGACVGAAPCAVSITAASSVTALFTRKQYVLNVLKSGAGLGTVTSSPASITCGPTCSATWDADSTVVLTAVAEASSLFGGWSGGGCTGTGPCSVSLTAATTVTANFLSAPTLSVSKTGTGTVTSSPTGINCGATCSAKWATGTTVTLTATPSGLYTFGGWSGACSGTSPVCTVTLDAAKSVGALFNPITYTLNVSKVGAGTVTSVLGGITCGGICSHVYSPYEAVALNATPVADYSFSGWSGDCTGLGTCYLTMDSAKNVTATFSRPNYAFVTSVTTSGDMGGLVGADGLCQARAAAASLPGTYRAWLSTPTTNAAARLSAGGWKRTDELPFATSVAELVAGKILYPLRLNEFGTDVFTVTTFTSTKADGTLQAGVETCSDWAAAAGQSPAGAGTTGTGTGAWTTGAFASCGSARALYCFGVSETGASVLSPPPAARLAFVTSATFTPGGGVQAADALCALEAQAVGLPGSYLALLTVPNTAAASRFSTAGTPWVRVDGVQLSATAAQLFSEAYWAAPLNVTASGAYVNDVVWTGAPRLDIQGSPSSTCAGWTAPSPQNVSGTGAATDSNVANAFSGSADLCQTAHRLYCLQE